MTCLPWYSGAASLTRIVSIERTTHTGSPIVCSSFPVNTKIEWTAFLLIGYCLVRPRVYRPYQYIPKGSAHTLHLYINLRRSRDCLCVSVARGRRPTADPAAFFCLCHRAASFTYIWEMLRCPHKRIVTITKAYIARNTIHVEVIRFHTN